MYLSDREIVSACREDLPPVRPMEPSIPALERNTLAGTQELMRAPEVGLILATGGTGLVRAAYSSGKPAYGVGPGNVPAFIEHTANVQKAVADIFAGKTF